jgi:DUF2934 family protein
MCRRHIPAHRTKEEPMPDEDRIRRRAQAIWEREGRPEGRQQEHWAQARREIEAEEKASPPRAAAPDDSPTPAAPDHGGTTPAEAAAAAVAAPRKAERTPEPSLPPDGQAHDPAVIID